MRRRDTEGEAKRDRRITGLMLVLGCVAILSLGVSASAGAATKGFEVKNASGLTLKVAAVEPYGGSA
jgi:hypothetical protein